MRHVISLWTGILFFAMQTDAEGQSEAVKPEEFIAVPPGAGLLSYPGEWKFTKGRNGGAFSLVEIKTATARDEWRGPRHVHTREDEAWYVIDTAGRSTPVQSHQSASEVSTDFLAVRHRAVVR